MMADAEPTTEPPDTETDDVNRILEAIERLPLDTRRSLFSYLMGVYCLIGTDGAVCSKPILECEGHEFSGFEDEDG